MLKVLYETINDYKEPLFFIKYTQDSVLESTVPWRTFNIHAIVPFQKRVFIEESGSLEYKNVLHI